MLAPIESEQPEAGMLAPDCRAWAASAEARAFGVRFSLRVDDAALLSRLLERLPPGARVCTGTHAAGLRYSIVTSTDHENAGRPPSWGVYAGDELVANAATPSKVLEIFEGRVRFDVARLAARWTFVHAGVVEWNGRAILVPGSSYSGKSRLVEALVRAGAGYYSDEYAALDSRGRVHAFAKPLTLRRDNGMVDRIEAADIGGIGSGTPIPVGVVVSTRYVPSARWRPREMPGGGTVLALLAHTLRAQVAPERVLRTLAEVAKTAVMLEGERGEAHETAGELLARLPAWGGTVEMMR
jgi:hypothetical protein